MRTLEFERRYPQTSVFFELALQKKKLDEVYHDLSLFLEANEAVHLLKKILTNPTLSIDFRNNLLGKVFEQFFKAEELSLYFLKLIIKKKKSNKIFKITSDFVNQYREYKGIVSATLTTPQKVSKDILEKLHTILQEQMDKKIELSVKEDVSLIGGFVVQTQGKQYDVSVKGKLDKIKKVLSN